ncbi:hypothetical protein B296_00029580, partial [Ensete ventricosum]
SPFSSPSSSNTVRNPPTTIKISRYRPTTTSDGRNRPLPTDFGWLRGGNCPNRRYHPVVGGPRTNLLVDR